MTELIKQTHPNDTDGFYSWSEGLRDLEDLTDHVEELMLLPYQTLQDGTLPRWQKRFRVGRYIYMFSHGLRMYKYEIGVNPRGNVVDYKRYFTKTEIEAFKKISFRIGYTNGKKKIDTLDRIRDCEKQPVKVESEH